MLVREMHIGIDIGVQKLNSEKLDNFGSEEKDWILNEVQLRFLKTRVNKRSNSKLEGFEDTIKRYLDIEEVIRRRYLNLYNGIDPNEMYAVLPYDTFLFIKSASEVLHDCKDINSNIITKTVRKCVVPFNDDIINLYKDYKITFDDGTTQTVLFDKNDYVFTSNNVTTNGLIDNDEKFYLVAHVLEVVNRINPLAKLEVRWENYDTEYYPNSFIFISEDLNSLTIDNQTSSTNNVIYNFTDYDRNGIITSVQSIGLKPNRLVKSDELLTLNETPFGNTKYHSPLSTLENGRLNVYHTKRFIFNRVQIQYIRKPRLISLSLNQSCEINDNFHEEIVDEAVQLIQARVNSNNYRNIINENLVKE